MKIQTNIYTGRMRGQLLVMFFLIALVTSASAGPELWDQGWMQRGDKKKKSKQGQTEKVAYNNALLIDAKKEAMIGNATGARDLLQRYLNRFPEDAVGYFELARIESELGNRSDAVRMCQEAVRLDPSNKWYSIFLAELYQVNGKIADAIILYEKIIQAEPDNLDYLYQLSALYLQNENFREAIRIYNQIESKAGVSEEISIQKEKIYLHLNDLKNAESELVKLTEAFPGESRYLSILAEFYISNKMPDKALEMYRKVAETDPGNPYIHMSLADYYRKTGDKAKAFEELKLGFANPNLDVDTKINILLSFYSVNELYNDLKEQAFILSKILVDTHPKDPKPYSIYGDLLAQDNKFEEARQAFLKVLSLDSSRYAIWEQVLRLDMQAEQYDHLVEYGNKALGFFPEQPFIYLLTGLGHYQKKQYDEALDLFIRGNLMVGIDSLLHSQFFMYQGDALHAMKKDDEAFRAYEKSIGYKNDNAYVLNNYAYYLSLKGDELDKAEAMSKKSLTLEPDNPSFQDTYGWILFKMGHFEQARVWIKKSLENRGESPGAEVMEHYGDVMYKLGNQAEALEYWIKARDKGPGSGMLEKKITEKKYYP